MAASDQGPAAKAGPPAGPSMAWTLALGLALLGVTALPRRRAGTNAAGAAEDPDAPLRSAPAHTGAEARRVAATEAGRGRQAEHPKDIPAPGWWDIVKRTYRDVGENRLLLVSAGVTFFVLLALFPGVAALVSSYGLIADVATINDHLAAMQGIVPSGAIEIVGEQVKRIAEQGDTTLGLTFLLGLGLSIWSANGGMKHVLDALNIVYGEREKRGFVRLNLVSLAFTAGALLFIVLALAAVVVAPVLLQTLGVGANAAWLAWLRWPLLLVAVLLGLTALYRHGPSRDAARWRWVTVGSVLAGLIWLGGSLLFSWYVANFGSYNETYGSLGAVIGFMTWIWISTTIVLLGAQVNAEMEHQTARDTTTGPEQPLGTREARMADSVAPAS